MEYIAWSDGSLNKEKAYVSYVIVDQNENVISQYKAMVNQLKTSMEAEYMAFYLMLEEIKELGLQNLNIYSDCLCIVEDFIKKVPIKNQSFPFLKLFLKKVGMHFYHQVVPKIKWMPRKHNQAHPLFEDIDSDCYVIDAATVLRSKKINLKSTKIVVEKVKTEVKANKRKRAREQHIQSAAPVINELFTPVPNTPYKIKQQALEFFLHSVDQAKKIDSNEKALELIRRKIDASVMFEENGKKVLVKGRLHMYLKDNILIRIQTHNSHWTDLWKEQRPIQIEKANPVVSIKPSADEPAFHIPETKIVIEERLFWKIHRTTKSMKEQSKEKTLSLLSDRINHSVKFSSHNLTIYVKGKFHLFVANNLIQGYKIYNSEWSNLASIANKKETVA